MRMRIDELAATTGVTSRNIRAYREKGLLPAPELEGRTGFYTAEHVQRLDIIEDLQRRGFSLEAIRQTLDAWSAGGDLSHLLTMTQILNSPFQTEEAEVVPIDVVLGRFPEAAEDPALVARAIDLGLIEPEEPDRARIPSPLLLDAGVELTRIGVPLAEVLDLFETIRVDLADVAQAFVAIAERYLVEPVELGRPGAPSPAEVITSLERLRPLALEAIRPILVTELVAAVRRALGRLSGEAGPGTPGA